MKHGELRSIAHNIADSLASGIGLLIGAYELDVFGEAARSPDRALTVDFLAGTVSGGEVSAELARAVRLYRDALPGLCAKHRTTPAAFRELAARYQASATGNRFTVTIEDQRGRRSSTGYAGTPGRRVRT